MNHEDCTLNDSSHEAYEPFAASYGRRGLYGLVEQVLWELKPMIEELEGLWPTMPKVDRDGNSECPFAEDMFRRKQTLEIRILEKLTVLRRFQTEVGQELERCKRNLARISRDVGKLHHQIVQKKYDEGFCLQEQEHAEAVWHLSQIDSEMLRAQATLTASRRKEYPIPLSGETKSKGLPVSASSYPTPKAPRRVDREVSDLISLGRLPRKNASQER